MTRETKLRIHNITAKAALKFGTEAWVLKEQDGQRLEATQMKFLRHLLGITKLDRERNQSVREKLGVQNIVLEIQQYQREWLQHVARMGTGRIPKQALKCRPKGKRSFLNQVTAYILTCCIPLCKVMIHRRDILLDTTLLYDTCRLSILRNTGTIWAYWHVVAQAVVDVCGIGQSRTAEADTHTA
jgi:hypothetical protein